MEMTSANPAEAGPETVNDAANGAATGAAEACPHNPLQLHQPEPGCKCGKLRPPRKLHAAIGLWLTLFMCVHLAIAMTGIDPRQYQATVDLLHGWLMPGAVLLLILIPVLLQAASGLYLTAKEGVKYDIKRCDRGGKLRFFLQRWSGLAILAYLVIHVGNMRGWFRLAHGGNMRAGALAERAAFLHTASAFQPWNSPAAKSSAVALLLTGILGAVFHAANGMWSGAILWKVVSTERGKAWFGYVCTAVGIALVAMGAIAWYAFTLSPNVRALVAAAGH